MYWGRGSGVYLPRAWINGAARMRVFTVVTFRTASIGGALL